MAVQKSGLFGEPDLTDRYVGWIGLAFGLMALVCAVRLFLAFAVEVSPNTLTLRDPKTEKARRIAIASIETLHLSKDQHNYEYRLEVAVADGQRTTLGFWSKQEFEDVLKSIRQFYPATTSQRAELL